MAVCTAVRDDKESPCIPDNPYEFLERLTPGRQHLLSKLKATSELNSLYNHG